MNKKRQARGAPRPSAAPAQTANPITLSFTSPLKLQFDSDSQLQVTVVTPEKPPAPLNRSMRFLIIGVFLIALLWLFLWMRYLTLSFPQSAEFNDASLSIALAHPAYVAYGDEAEMELTVTNRGGQSFTGSVTVNFPSGVPVRPLASETTTIKIEKLAANASVTSRLKFALRQQTRFFSGEVIPTRLLFATDDPSFQPIPGPQIAVAPLPFLRTINSRLSNSVVVAAVADIISTITSGVGRARMNGWRCRCWPKPASGPSSRWSKNIWGAKPRSTPRAA